MSGVPGLAISPSSTSRAETTPLYGATTCREFARSLGHPEARARRLELGLCGLELGLGLVEGGLAHELLLEQLLGPLVARLGVLEPRACLRHLCLTLGRRLRDLARVDSNDDRALLHVVPDVEIHGDDTTGYLC